MIHMSMREGNEIKMGIGQEIAAGRHSDIAIIDLLKVNSAINRSSANNLVAGAIFYQMHCSKTVGFTQLLVADG